MLQFFYCSYHCSDTDQQMGDSDDEHDSVLIRRGHLASPAEAIVTLPDDDNVTSDTADAHPGSVVVTLPDEDNVTGDTADAHPGSVVVTLPDEEQCYR